MSIKYKLILAFLVPSLMMLAVGFWSSIQMRSIGKKVGGMLEENEQSIQYAVRMIEAIERIDSAVLLRLQGGEDEFQGVYSIEHEKFRRSYNAAFKNITLPGERTLLDSLDYLAQNFFSLVESTSRITTVESYRLDMFPVFEKMRQTISSLRRLNSKAMYDIANNVLDSSERAALPGDTIMLTAILFMVLFGWLTNIYISSPIGVILQSVRRWRESNNFKPPELYSRDELQELVDELTMISARYN